MSEKEMFAEVNALVGAIGKALDLAPEVAAREVEAGAIHVEMETDERQQRRISLHYQGRTAYLYQGAIKHSPA